MSNTPFIFSGIQPSGTITLGNYLGAIRHWVELSQTQTHQAFYCLVDLHTLTVRQDPKQFKKNCYDLYALYLACGLDRQKTPVFIQSHVPQHTQLAWLLNCFTYMGELNRMTQFKDKSLQHEANINVGLFAYPTLMAADILLYQTTHVPVGEDQKQHLELARNIAIRFNQAVKADIFTVPEPMIATIGARIMSLQDPHKKMSKSDSNQNAFVSMLDSENSIRKKFKRAVTDSLAKIKYDPTNQPGISNLLSILSLTSHQSIDTLANDLSGEGYGALKAATAESVITTLTPIQEKFEHIRSDEKQLTHWLQEDAEIAKQRASKTLDKVQNTLGLIPIAIQDAGVLTK